MKDYSRGKKPEGLEPFFPNEILRCLISGLIVIVLFFLLVIILPETFQELTDGPSKLAQSMPAWYLYPFHKLFEYIANGKIALMVLLISAFALAAMPFLRVNKR